jgi:hypothetical protein
VAQVKCVCGALLITSNPVTHCPICKHPVAGRKIGGGEKKKTIKELTEEMQCRRGS